VIEPRPSREVVELAESKGIALGPPSRPPQVLVLAMKPQNLDEAAAGLAPFASRDTLVVSILVGKTIADVAARLPHATAIVRAMPNLAASVGRGMAALAANAAATPGQRATAEALFAATGRVEWLAGEELIDAAAAVSGSGPAYVFISPKPWKARGRPWVCPPQSPRGWRAPRSKVPANYCSSARKAPWRNCAKM
jgi:pyrroline-5-carboxylate reductase